MTKKASKEQPKGKSKARKLRLNKETVKDLDARDPSGVKGGDIIEYPTQLPTTCCQKTWGCVKFSYPADTKCGCIN